MLSPLPFARLTSRRLSQRLAAAAALVVVALPLAACGEIGRLLTPGSTADAAPAQVAFTTSVAASVGGSADVVTLEVGTRYLRRNGSSVLLGTQTRSLDGGATQALPIPVNLAACLADSERDAPSPQDRSCNVVFNLALLINGVVVDRQVVGPLRLSPGTTTSVAEPVALFEITAVDVSVTNGPAVLTSGPLTAIPGGALSLAAIISDRRGQVVTDRAVVWSSDAPGVATIDSASGKVTAIAMGVARITAAFGTVATTVSLRVLRSPAALTITAGPGSGRGTVRSTPAGIDCRIDQSTASGPCAFIFPGDAEVSLVSTADSGSVSNVWSSTCENGNRGSRCQVTMDQPRIVSTSFAALRRVSVSAEGSDGRGRVTGPSGLDCRIAGTQSSGVCAIDVVDGTGIVLTASTDGPDAASASRQFFAGWGGDCASSVGDSCTLTATRASRTVTVRFFDEQQLIVTLVGSGGGWVTAVDGLACALAGGRSVGICTQRAVFGSKVTLTAVPDSQSAFVEWRGACQGQSGTSCTLMLTKALAATATFVAQRRLNVKAGIGDGRGRVSGVEGLDCRIHGAVASGSCEVLVSTGARLTLRASAESGTSTNQTFAGWGGECAAATGAICDLTATGSAQTVVAHFFDEQRISVNVLGDGGGRVVQDGGITCVRSQGVTGGICDGRATFGTSVTLTASPDPQSTFGGWSGECESQSSTTCTTLLTKARAVSASFTLRPVTLTLHAAGPAAGRFVVNGQPACALALGQGRVTCILSFQVGTLVAIGGVPATNARFAGFGGDCLGTATCQVAMLTSRTVSAQFENHAPVTLAVSLTGKGLGSVTSLGAIACNLFESTTTGTCTEVLPFGSSITLTTASSPKTKFVAWSGACAGQSGSICTLTLTSNAAVGAEFLKAP